MKIEFLKSDANYAKLFLEYRLDPITRQFNPLLNQTLDELQKRLTETSSDLSLYKDHESFTWFISANGKTIGTASIQNINQTMLTAEIGYGVFAENRGRGYAKKIVQQLTEKVFSQTDIRKIIAYVHENNFASRKVLEKSGYIQEGLLREHYLINNIPSNEVIYGILRHEYLKKKIPENL